MRMKYLAIAATLLAATPVAAAEPITGSWVTAARDGVVRIAPCARRFKGDCELLLDALLPDEVVERARPQ